MRVLYLMRGHTRQDRIKNVGKVGVAPYVEKMVEFNHRWFGHVPRRPIEALKRRLGKMEDSLLLT